MTRSKKIFLALAVAFFLILIWIIYDMSRRTTFPGAKKPEKGMAVSMANSHSSPK